jgi:hypothetical protein
MYFLMLASTASFSLAKQTGSPQSPVCGVHHSRYQVSSALVSLNDHETNRQSSGHFLRHSGETVNHIHHPESANDTGQANPDPHYLPSGYYDALGNTISEKEYFY